jgi:hypothetical protein
MGNDLMGEFSSGFMADPTAWVHQLPGGIAQNNISHPLSMILEFLKDEKPAIDAHGFRWRKTRYGDSRDRFFDELRVLLMGQETTAHMIFSCFSRPIQRYVVVYGTRGQVTASLDAQTVRWITPTSVPNPFKKILLASRDMKQAGQHSLKHLRDFLKGRLHTFESMNTLFRQFYLAIEGKAEVPIHKSEIIRLTAIMDTIFEHCHEHTPEPGTMETFA